MFKKRPSSATGIQSSTHVAVRPGYELLPGAVGAAASGACEGVGQAGRQAQGACSECAWAHGDYGQAGGLVLGLTSGYGAQAGHAATHACLQLQQALPTGKQWIKLGKGKQMRGLMQAFASVSTPAAISAERGRSGALGVALFVCPQSSALFLASTGAGRSAACSAWAASRLDSWMAQVAQCWSRYASLGRQDSWPRAPDKRGAVPQAEHTLCWVCTTASAHSPSCCHMARTSAGRISSEGLAGWRAHHTAPDASTLLRCQRQLKRWLPRPPPPPTPTLNRAQARDLHAHAAPGGGRGGPPADAAQLPAGPGRGVPLRHHRQPGAL
jgi:hypothetical protein